MVSRGWSAVLEVLREETALFKWTFTAILTIWGQSNTSQSRRVVLAT